MSPIQGGQCADDSECCLSVATAVDAGVDAGAAHKPTCQPATAACGGAGGDAASNGTVVHS